MTIGRLVTVIFATSFFVCLIIWLSGCNGRPYFETGMSIEVDDQTLAQFAFGGEWLYQTEYREMVFDLRYQHKSDPDRKDIDGGLDELEFNTRFYLDWLDIYK